MASRLSSFVLVSSIVPFTLFGCSSDPAPVAADAAADTPADVAPLDVAVDTPAADTPAPDVAPDVVPDAPRDAAADVAPDAPAPACNRTRALITTSNFTRGGYAIGPFAPPSLMVPMAASPDQDHLPVESGCLVFTLLRGDDTLAVLDPTNLPAILRRVPLRPSGVDGGMYGANPYDVEVVSPTRAYVTQYALSRIAIVDPSRDGAAAVTGSIDLAPVRAMADTDASGAPEAAELLRVGDRVFAVMQNLAAFAPVAPGSLAVIDAAAGTLIDADPMTAGTQPVVLTQRNPVGAVATAGGRIVLAGAGTQPFMPPNVLDGAIEAIDAATLRPVGMRVTEMALGGDLQGLVMLDENRGWALTFRFVMGGGREARVVAFDLSTGMAGATIFTTGDIGGMAKDPTGNVWVLDRTMATPGARVFRPDGTQLTTAPLATGLPPYGVAFVP